MTVDVDAVNERLNGLVNLLHIVGIDGVDPDKLIEEQKKIAQKSDSAGIPTSAQSSDAQILEIIKKLQQAQADSPEILAALKSPELRALASLAAQRQAPRDPEPQKKAPPSLDDVMEDDDDNYPKIGPGYSDDISVVSDLTTPTVMTKQQVADEEYYRDVNGGPGALPPMNIALGGPPHRPTPAIGGHAAPQKRKDLVSQVRPSGAARAIAKPGGAAAQRRLNYQQAMAKLQATEYGTPTAAKGKKDVSYMDSFSPKKGPKEFFPITPPTPVPDPSELPSIGEVGGKIAAKPKKVAVKDAKGKSKKTSLASQEMQDISFGDTGPVGKKKGSKDLEWGGDGDSGWPAFDEKKKKTEKDVFVDNDGFFAGDAFGQSSNSGSAFGSNKSSGSDPFTSPKSPKKGKVNENIKRYAEITVTRDDGTGGAKSKTKKKDNAWKSDKIAKKEKEKPSSKGSGSRRASLSM